MYDVCSRQTFSKLDAWFEELETYATNTNIVKMLVGNKIDKVMIESSILIVILGINRIFFIFD